MIKYNLPDFSEINEVFSAKDKESLSLIGTNCHSLYHISDCLRPLISEILDRTDNSLNDQKGGRGNA